jgi:hypothetical protein
MLSVACAAAPSQTQALPDSPPFPPRLEVVAAADAVEAGLLGLDRLSQQVVGRELLVGAEWK